MSDFKSKLNSSLGLEDEAPNVQVNIDTDEMGMPLDNVTSDGENTPEADEVEIIEESSDIEAEDDVIEEMAEAADSLESIYIAMESAQANGGMTPEAAQFASIAVANVVGRYGATSQDIGISLEAFGDNRATATTVSMEGIKDTLKTLWETIVKKFQALVKKITDFFKKTIGAAPSLKRRAEGIKKAARNTTGSTTETTFKSGGLFRALNTNNDTVSASAIIAGLKGTAAAFERNATKESIEKRISAVFPSATEIQASSDDNVALATKIAGTLVDGASVVRGGDAYKVTGSGGATPTGFKPAGNDKFTTLSVVSNLPGNKIFWVGAIHGTVKPSNAFAAIRTINAGMYPQVNAKADAKKDAEQAIKILSTSEVQGICDVVIANMDIIIKSKTQADKKLNDVAIMKKAGDKVISELKDTDADGGGDKTRVSNVINGMVDACRRRNTADAMLLRYNYTASKAALSYCQQSLSKYKKA